jgi:hypothetical protein
MFVFRFYCVLLLLLFLLSVYIFFPSLLLTSSLFLPSSPYFVLFGIS